MSNGTQMAGGFQRMRANRKIIEANCRTCGRRFAFGEEIFACTVCGAYHHVPCWDNSSGCRHDSADPVSVASAATDAGTDQTPPASTALAEHEEYCPQCREVIKSNALRCRFCGHILNAELSPSVEAAAFSSGGIEGRQSNRRMAKHVKILAYSALVVGLLFLLAVVAELFPKSSPPGTYVPSGVQSANPAMAVLTLIMFVLPCLFVFIGLKSFKPWGRTISMGLAILTIASPVSWYALWVLTQYETKWLFGVQRTVPGSQSPLKIVGYVLFIPLAVLINIGFVSGLVKSITGPSSTRVIPIADVASGQGSDTGYCGMDPYGKLTPGRPISIEGTVTAVNTSNRTYVLQDASLGITVVVNRQFPPPVDNEKLRVMGIVQCPPLGSFAGKLVHEIMRSPAKSKR